MFAPQVIQHTSIQYLSFSPTRVNMGKHGHYIHSHHLAAEMLTTMKNNLLGKKFLSCSFYPYRFHEYISYGFPIINFCNPGVHYEMPCIFNFYLGQTSSNDVSHIPEDNLNMNKHDAPKTNRCPLTTSLLKWNAAKVKRIGYQPLSEKSRKN
jgi:hypothetical protein